MDGGGSAQGRTRQFGLSYNSASSEIGGGPETLLLESLIWLQAGGLCSASTLDRWFPWCREGLTLPKLKSCLS